MEAILNKNVIKEALRELIKEEPETFKAMLREVLAEGAVTENDDAAFEQLIQRNFKRFDATFRALA